MTKRRSKLSPESVAILNCIAKGHTYEQILALHPDFTYLDIFDAAREALELDEQTSVTYEQRLAQIREAYPRAYEKWSYEEDAELERLVRSGRPIADIAGQLERQPSAIRNRIAKRNLGEGAAL